ERAEGLGYIELEPDEDVVGRAAGAGQVEHVTEAFALVHRDHREAAAGAGDGIEVECGTGGDVGHAGSLFWCVLFWCVAAETKASSRAGSPPEAALSALHSGSE